VLVSTTSFGQQVTDGFFRGFSAPTSDGRYVAFISTSESFPNAGSFADDYLYIKDLQTGTVVNHSDYNGSNYFDVSDGHIYLSDDGQFVTFTTFTSIDPLHVNFDLQVYRKNLENDTFEMVGISFDGLASANDNVNLRDVSDNGRFILIASDADNLTTDVLNNNGNNLYIRDTQNQTTTLVNKTPSGDSSAFTTSSNSAAISNAGYVAFTSQQSDLILNDNNGNYDVFYYQNGSIERISLKSNGDELTEGLTGPIDISGDSSRIIYAHTSAEIVANDNNAEYDLFSYKTNTQSTTLMTQNANGSAANNYSLYPFLSTDGNRAVFISFATDLTADPATGSYYNLFYYNFNSAQMRNETTAVFSPITSISSVYLPRISSNQRFASYITDSPNFVDEPLDSKTFDLFLLDRTDNTHSKIASNTHFIFNDISSSGDYVVFASNYSQPDANVFLGAPNVFLYNRVNNNYVQLDEGQQYKVNNNGAVVFETTKGIDPNDTNQISDIYAYNPQTQAISLISKDLNGNASGASAPDIGGSNNNIWITFSSVSANLVAGDLNGLRDIFMVKFPNGTISRVSQTLAGVEADGYSSIPAISEDASSIVFLTEAQNLTNDDYTLASSEQVLVYKRSNQTLSLASKNEAGLPLSTTNPNIHSVSISDTARYVAYGFEDDGSFAPDFAEDTDLRSDIILFDSLNQSSKLISKFINGSHTSDASDHAQVVEDLSVNPPLIGVVFQSTGGDLTLLDNHPGVYNEAFLYQQGGPLITLNINVQGLGTVTGTSAISCNDNCQFNFALGTELTLIAMAENDNTFTGWQVDFGDCHDDSNPCYLNMDREKTLTAIFTGSSDVIFSNGFE